ncbi:MAG TPA: 30S ribosomal protein S4 [Firmicutes bacterium]|nr:30S ribosomal protein S4 [Bacillota bacterium]
MSRYLGPVWKKSRHLGYSILGTGEELAKRPYGPGQHGNDRKGKVSEYGRQLLEKQKLRYTYGVSERQFRRYFGIAKKARELTGLAFMQVCERRLDNIVFRLGFASTRRQARQLVSHGHVTVNGKKVDIPSYLVEIGEVISLKEKSKTLKLVKDAQEKIIPVKYVTLDKNKLEGSLTRLPERAELSSDIDEAQIVEFYNRKSID